MMYHYLWMHSMLGPGLQTVDGRPVEVEYPGRHNSDSGPDFTGARLRIGGDVWVGNVEVHVKASDWFRHHHDNDPAYNNVILHVVGDNDRQIPDGRGGEIAQLHVHVPDSFSRMYMRLADKIGAVKCEDCLGDLSSLTVVDWLATLATERMQVKASRVHDLVKLLDGDWEWACFVTLARALGFGLNSEPFEMLARKIPLRILLKHSDDTMQLEALLFGQAGMLDTSVHIFDEYYQMLCREYIFLAHKYDLRPMHRDIWKFSKTRPQNFPSRRIAMLARAVTGGFRLLSELVDAQCDIETSRALMNWKLGGYWEEHFDFDMPGTRLPSELSAANIDLLLINFVAPMLYAYGASRGDADLAGRGVAVWEELRPENNVYIRQWRNAGIKCLNASDSQALIQLRREYCDRGRCLACRFGHTLLRSEVSTKQG